MYLLRPRSYTTQRLFIYFTQVVESLIHRLNSRIMNLYTKEKSKQKDSCINSFSFERSCLRLRLRNRYVCNETCREKLLLWIFNFLICCRTYAILLYEPHSILPIHKKFQLTCLVKSKYVYMYMNIDECIYYINI